MTVTSAANCDTDTCPLVPEVEFRCYEGTPDYEIAAIASAILFARYCGALAEFEGAKVSLDAAAAIRRIAPDIDELMPIDGMKREICQGVSTLVVGEARCMLEGRLGAGGIGRSARAVTWSGDFVDAQERNSTGHVAGDVFTNARLIADSTETSAALALLVGGNAVRDIYVPAPPGAEQESLRRIASGLEFVGIKLQAL